MYFEGRGVDKNYQKALEYLNKSADQGNVDAQVNLGDIYYKLNEVDQDYEKALQWYKKAADQGDAEAQFNLDMIYSNGLGVQKIMNN